MWLSTNKVYLYQDIRNFQPYLNKCYWKFWKIKDSYPDGIIDIFINIIDILLTFNYYQ